MRRLSGVVGFLILGCAFWGPMIAGPEVDEWMALDGLGASLAEGQVDELFAVYATAATSGDWFRGGSDGFEMRFSEEGFAALEESLPEWRIVLPEANLATPESPLVGWRIALDPGHMGGEWGPMESRSFQIGEGPVAQEGDLVLATAFHLKKQLEAMGAEVLLLRDTVGPVTDFRPDGMMTEAVKDGEPLTKAQAKRHFLREDIRSRGGKLEAWGAHVVFALHVNASTWPDPENFSLVEGNHGHVLINGAYLDDELGQEEQRAFLVRRWLSGFHAIEREIGSAVARAMAESTGLEPFAYTRSNAVRVNENPFVWGRNLMAGRIFSAPVVYLEPWVLNSEAVYPWGSLGDYEGVRLIDGVERASLPRVYADFVAEGMRRFGMERAD